jgi:sensor histidine kinase regulating citrate/malate metabolism
MENHEVSTESVELLRIQRHDFINHLQVIHALLQLGRAEKALTYIEELAKGSSLISNTLKIYAEQRDSQKKA